MPVTFGSQGFREPTESTELVGRTDARRPEVNAASLRAPRRFRAETLALPGPRGRPQQGGRPGVGAVGAATAPAMAPPCSVCAKELRQDNTSGRCYLCQRAHLGLPSRRCRGCGSGIGDRNRSGLCRRCFGDHTRRALERANADEGVVNLSKHR